MDGYALVASACAFLNERILLQYLLVAPFFIGAVPNRVVGLRVEQDVVGDIAVCLTSEVLRLALLAGNHALEVLHAENLVHHHLDMEDHVAVQMDVDGAFRRKKPVHQLQALAHKVEIVLQGETVIIGSPSELRMTKSTGRVGLG